MSIRRSHLTRSCAVGAALAAAVATRVFAQAPEAPPVAPTPPAAPAPPPAGPPMSAAPPVADSELTAALAADQAAQAPRTQPVPSPPTGARGAGSLMNPDLSLIADFAAAWFSEDENLQTGGHDPTVTGPNLQQLELSVGSSVDPYFRFDGNIVFTLFGVEVEEAYGTTLDLPGGLQARLGQFLHRFGRLNSTHPHSWDFVDQPFSLGRVFGGEGGRGLGAELSWLTPLPWYVEVVGTATQAGGEATARSFFGGNDPGIDGLKDLLYVTALKQFFPLGDDWSLAWGLSSAFGPNSTGRASRTDVYGTDLYLKFRPITRESPAIVSLQTEWLYRRRQVPEAVLQDASGYTQVFWRFAQRWGTAARYDFGSPAVDTAGRIAGDPLDPAWTAARHRVSANVTHWPSEFSRLRLQGSRDMPGWLPEPVWAVFLAVEFVTGAHGAHEF